jgi:hypothetical protein
MGIRTDLTSLGAIGLGTAVAVVGTGALLFAGVSRHVDARACVDVPTVATVTAVPAVPAISDAAAAAEAPEAPQTHRVSVVVSDRIQVRTECVAELDERIVDLRVQALEQAEAARVRAADVRVLADEIRAEAEAIRAEARANGEVDPDRIQALVEAALADAGIRRGGSWGN